MRPVNLIPEEQRRSAAGTRTGPLAFIVVGALFALFAGVVMLVLASNQISSGEGEVAALKVRKAAVAARAEKLAPYVDFQQVAEQRTQTVVSLANSRFDWARVIHQVSLIVPKYVVLIHMSGSAGGPEGGSSSGSSDFSSEIEGPSISMEGCAKSQNRVAAMVAALKQIDGVTRVGLSGSAVNESGSSEGSGSSAKCLPGNLEFAIVAAFDAAPPPPESTTSESAPEPAESESSESSSSEPASSSESSGSTKTTVSKTTTVTPSE